MIELNEKSNLSMEDKLSILFVIAEALDLEVGDVEWETDSDDIARMYLIKKNKEMKI